MYDLFHRAKKPHTHSHWLPLEGGLLTAAGAPSVKRLGLWLEHGATDVVTLQRRDEMAPGLAEACEALGLRWHHLPLSGRHLSELSDLEGLRRTPELLGYLRAGAHLVVHCSAGMHRTGVCLYLLLRAAGIEAEQALEQIRQVRQVTGDELLRSNRAGDTLHQRAEDIFTQLSPDWHEA